MQNKRGYTFGICDRDLGANALAGVYFFTLVLIFDMIIDYQKTTDNDISFERAAFSLYESWLVKHDRQYEDSAEKETRFKIFMDNFLPVNRHNRLVKSTYKLGLNRFADLTNDEFRSLFLGGGTMVRKDMLNNSNGFKYENVDDHKLPVSIDRDKGAVAPVKDQGQCG